MVMEASRAEYLADDSFKLQIGRRESSTSKAEPSSSGASEYIFFPHTGCNSSIEQLLASCVEIEDQVYMDS